MKRALLIFISILTVIMCHADNNGVQEKALKIFEIEGIYIKEGNPYSGLIIEKLDNGNYLFREASIYEDDEIYKYEWQGAYVQKSETNNYMFYWHTGRFDDDKPETNGIIVYELEAYEDGLKGIYYFPEETRTPPAGVTYKRIR